MSRRTSLRVFKSFITRRQQGNNDGEGYTLDASGVISRECYLAWTTARYVEQNDEEAHRYCRTLVNHLAGTVRRCLHFTFY